MAHTKPEQLFLNKAPKSRWQRIYLFPLSRILIAILFLIPVVQLSNLYSFLVLDQFDGALLLVFQAIRAIAFIALLILVYGLYTKYIEKRAAFEFKKENWHKEFGTGILIGGGMVVLITTVLLVAGFYQVDQVNSPQILLSKLFRYAHGSFIEDLIFTIVIFRLLEEFLGTITSYILVSLLFGAMHFGNDNATIQTSLFISIQHITLLAPFILTRRMWMCWAIHLSWNFFQAGVFGMNNSGMKHDGFITPIISGPEWLTGGSFGIEGSWISLVLNLLVGILILVYAIRKKQIVGFLPKQGSSHRN